MILGSFLYVILTGKFRLESFSDRGDMVRHMIGGVFMGFGGVLALGCTIGQGITGMTTLALGSVLTLISIIFGSALTMKVEYYRLDDEGFFSALRCALADMHLFPAAQKKTEPKGPVLQYITLSVRYNQRRPKRTNPLYESDRSKHHPLRFALPVHYRSYGKKPRNRQRNPGQWTALPGSVPLSSDFSAFFALRIGNGQFRPFASSTWSAMSIFLRLDIQKIR